MTEETMIAEIARTLGIRPAQVQSALSLFAQGNTIPFIARYRKEATGTLDEVQLRCIQEQYEYEQALASRKETVRQSIMDQGCWNDDLARSLEAARQLQDVEDLYLPYKPKKRTKASMAREAGLEPLADCFDSQDPKGRIRKTPPWPFSAMTYRPSKTLSRAQPTSWPNAFRNGPISAATCAANCGSRPA